MYTNSQEVSEFAKALNVKIREHIIQRFNMKIQIATVLMLIVSIIWYRLTSPSPSRKKAVLWLHGG